MPLRSPGALAASGRSPVGVGRGVRVGAGVPGLGVATAVVVPGGAVRTPTVAAGVVLLAAVCEGRFRSKITATATARMTSAAPMAMAAVRSWLLRRRARPDLPPTEDWLSGTPGRRSLDGFGLGREEP